MSLLDSIEKIRGKTFATALLALLLLFAPGTAYIFYFWNDLFISLDFLKLLSLSVSIVTPFIFLNFFFSALMFGDDDTVKSDELIFLCLVMGIIFSAFALYISLVIAIFMDENIFFSIKIAMGFEVLMLFVAIFGAFSNWKRTKTKN